MSSLPNVLTFVDVETTGTSARYGRVIEVGVLRLEEGKLTKQYETLIDPQMRLDPFITTLTGITSQELESAPTFRDIKDTLLDLFADAILVAHNARFDHAFLKYEFERYGVEFQIDKLCTVRFARALFPGYSSYSLENLISNLKIKVTKRHRAFEDARVLVKLYEMAIDTHGEDRVASVIASMLKRQSLPPYLSKELLDKLPKTPGVYTFFGEDGSPLYIGKSINVKDRVLSHFALSGGQAADSKLYKDVRHIEVDQTAGEIGALLLESAKVKELLPIYNQQLRKSRVMTIICQGADNNGYHTAYIQTLDPKTMLDEVSSQSILALCRSKKQAMDLLRSLVESQHLCPKLLGLEKRKGECFSSQLGICKGACVGKDKINLYNLRFEQAFVTLRLKRWPYKGKIVIKEEWDEKQEYFVIDQWCYLGSVRDTDDIETMAAAPYRFDYDTYKILVSALMGKKKGIKVYEID